MPGMPPDRRVTGFFYQRGTPAKTRDGRLAFEPGERDRRRGRLLRLACVTSIRSATSSASIKARSSASARRAGRSTSPQMESETLQVIDARYLRPEASRAHQPAVVRQPLAVLSPGFTSPRSTPLTALAKDLASHGYVVAGIDHTYESFASARTASTASVCAPT